MMTSASSWFVFRSSLLTEYWNCSILVPVFVLSCGHQFSLIVLNVVNHIMTCQISQLYLAVHYVESHVLGGQCSVKAELVLSTSIIVWSTGSRHLLYTVSDVPVKYQVYVTAFQVILDGPNEVDYVVIDDATCGPLHSQNVSLLWVHFQQ